MTVQTDRRMSSNGAVMGGATAALPFLFKRQPSRFDEALAKTPEGGNVERKKKAKTFRLSARTIAQIEALAERRGESMAIVITIAIEQMAEKEGLTNTNEKETRPA